MLRNSNLITYNEFVGWVSDSVIQQKSYLNLFITDLTNLILILIYFEYKIFI